MNLRDVWLELVAENPMLIEIQRFRRRFLSFGGSSTLSGIVLGIAIVCYIGVLMLVLSARGSMPPIAMVLVQTFVFTLVAPSMMYGSIAGEREKRTWDLLVAAPVTKGQIVAGKFIGGLAALGVGFLLFLLPVLITALEFEQTNWFFLLEAELVSISFSILVAAMTLFFSARSRRAFMALGTVLGVLFLYLLVVPIMTQVTLADRLLLEFLNFFHPFYVQAQLLMADAPRANDALIPMGAWGFPQIIAYLLLSCVFVAWATNTLMFAENDVKFIPRKPHA